VRIRVIQHVEERAAHRKQTAIVLDDIALDLPVNVTVSGKGHYFVAQFN
jgi:hypothetical protein